MTSILHDPTADPAELRLRLNRAAGYTLPNGAVILQSKEVASGQFVVLCLSHNEFVTWALHVSSTGDQAEAFWGHYKGANLDAALADFEERA